MARFSSYDLPFDTDSSARFIPWIIALTTFIGSIFVLGTLTFSSVISQWSHDLSGQATVQIPVESTRSPQESYDLKAQVVAYLNRLESVERAYALDAVTTYRLLEPWLGRHLDQLNLPIPMLVAVTLKKQKTFDAIAVGNDLVRLSPGIRITEHEQVHQSILRAAEGFRLVGHFILILITVACVGALIFSTYTGLIVHQDVIKVLMLVGARPAYVASQFQRHTLKLALKGTLYNYLLLGVVVGLLVWFVGRMDFPVPLQGVSFSTLGGIVIFVPLAMIVVMTLTARMTVSYVLARKT